MSVCACVCDLWGFGDIFGREMALLAIAALLVSIGSFDWSPATGWWVGRGWGKSFTCISIEYANLQFPLGRGGGGGETIPRLSGFRLFRLLHPLENRQIHQNIQISHFSDQFLPPPFPLANIGSFTPPGQKQTRGRWEQGNRWPPARHLARRGVTTTPRPDYRLSIPTWEFVSFCAVLSPFAYYGRVN